MTSASLDHDVARTTSFDGTSLAIRPLGTGGGVPRLVVPAVGVDLSIWRNVLHRTVAARRAVTWDLRGMHDSGLPQSDRIDAGAHAEDAIAVLDFLGVERVHIAAWSTATRIGLELAHRHPDRVESLALVCGAYGYPASKLLRNLDPAGLMPLLAGVGKHFSGALGIAMRSIVGRSEIAGLIRQSGLVGPTADISAAVDVLRSLAACDTRRFLAMFEAVTRDAAVDILPEIDAPALVIGGERDSFTPRSLLEETAGALPRGRLEIYERGTHYVPLEFEARLADDLEDLARTTET